VRITTWAEYGLICALHLAKRAGEGPITGREIAAGERLPADYVEQILLRLRRAGLVTSTRGARGGYSLTRDPGDIRMSEVLRALEGPIVPMVCANEDPIHALDCGRTGFCNVNLMWVRVREAIVSTLESLTLADVSRGVPPAHRVAAADRISASKPVPVVTPN